MKKSSSYKMRIPVSELLNYPNACLMHDVLSQTGSTVLIPSKIPISKLTEGLENPKRILDSLERLNIKMINIEIPQEMDDEEIVSRLTELDPSVKIIDGKVTEQAEKVMGNIYANLSISDKYSIPKDEVEDLGKTLSQEIADVSQIALSLVTSDHDSYTQSHALNVSLLAGYIAKKLVDAGKAPAELVDKTILAGLLFDIGKTAIPKEILHKTEKLSEEELAIVRSHIQKSLALCKQSGINDKEVIEGIASHHERYDGSGYPKGLVGTQIPLIGRILAVADTFDAMTSPQVYKNAVSSKLSFNFIMSANETSFDPDICKIFVSGMGVYPPGSTVELSNGQIGTVVAMTAGNLLQPKIAIKTEMNESKIIDLSAEKLFIKRSLDMEPPEEVNLLATLL